MISQKAVGTWQVCDNTKVYSAAWHEAKKNGLSGVEAQQFGNFERKKLPGSK